MMPMKKITFNAPLNHKAYSYEPMQIEVEKIIPLYDKRFEQMRDHPLEDAPEIIENRDLMHILQNVAMSIPDEFTSAVSTLSLIAINRTPRCGKYSSVYSPT